MKKSLFMLLMLWVAGMAASCEREFVNANNETGRQTNSTVVEENNAEENIFQFQHKANFEKFTKPPF